MKLIHSIQKILKAKSFGHLAGIMLFITACHFSVAQNINTVSKKGPMGIEANTYTGNMYMGRFDFALPNRELPLVIGFSYNSVLFDANTGFGNGWSFAYDINYRLHNDTVTIFWSDGREDIFTPSGGGTYKGETGVFDNLSQYEPGKFRVEKTNGYLYKFEDASHKKITSITTPNGNQLTLNYSGGKISSINTTAGKSVTLQYNANNHVSSITDATLNPARSWTYEYDGAGNLVKVTDPLGKQFRYKYFVNGPMVSVMDKNANEVNIVYYEGFAVSEIIGCNKRLSFSYDTVKLTTVVTEYNPGNANQVTTFQYERKKDNVWLKSFNGNCCGYNVALEYDEDGNKTKETDANGNITLFTYDAFGNITSLTDPLGQKYTYAYTPDFKKVASTTDAKGLKAEMNYDAKGNLIKLTEPGNLVSTATYNVNGDITSSTDPNGNVLTYEYDLSGNLTKISGSEGLETIFTYNNRGELTGFTDSKGNTGSMEYDILSRLKKITDPLNKQIDFGYDGNGNTTQIKDRAGKQSVVKYDASDRLVEYINTNGEKNTLRYDAMDNLVSFSDGLGNKSNFSYDNRNRLVEAINVLGEKVSLGYDGNSNLTSLKLQGGRDLQYSYDRMDRLTSIRDNQGTVAEYTYDQNGNVIAYKNAAGAFITAGYDANNQITSITDELGNSYKIEYDNNKNISAVTDRMGQKKQYTYDGLNRVTIVQDNNGNSIKIEYDSNGNIAKLKDQNNNESVYTYDALNRITKSTFPDGKFSAYTYDNKGNILTRTYRNGDIIQYTYDVMDRLTGKTLPDGNTFQFAYDAAGRMISASNKEGAVVLTYDALNRITSETSQGKTVRYAYNATGRTHSILYPGNSLIIRNFDERNNLLSIVEDGKLVVSFTYNNLNQPLTRTTGNGVTTQYQYDFAGKLIGYNTQQGSIQQVSLTYDKENNKLKTIKGHNNNGSEEFGYDAEYRLTSFKKGPIPGSPLVNTTYSYDALGNRTSSTTNGLTSTYTINNLNQVTRKQNTGEDIQYTFDINGNLAYDGKYYKTYDTEGRLTKDSANPSSVQTYSYDAFGRQITSTQNGVTNTIAYSGSSAIEAYNGPNLIQKNILVNFLTPVSTEKDSKKYFYHQNELNSVDAITNETGRVIEKYEYDAYGEMVRLDSLNNQLLVSPSGNRYGFTGQVYDSATGQLRFYFRSYNPATGTFNQQDLLGYQDGMGMYQYVGNNPANGIDVFGLKDCNEKTTVTVNTPPTPTYIDMGKGVSDATGAVGAVFSTAETINSMQLQKYKTLTQGVDMVEAYAKFGEKAFTNPAILKAGSDISKTAVLGPLGKVLGALGKAGPVLGAIDLGLKGASAYETFSDGNSSFDNKVDAVADVSSSSGNLVGGLAVAAAGAAGSTIAAPAAIVIAGTAIVDFGVEKVTGKNLRQHAEKPVDMLYNAPGKIRESSGSQYRLLSNPNYKSWVETFGLEESQFLFDIYNSGKGETYLKMLNRKKKDCPQDNSPGSRKNNPKGGGIPFTTEVINSNDPNEIIGPTGIGTPRWVSIKDQLPYTINFENSIEATAPAKVVTVYYPIDLKQSGNRFLLGSFGFNNQTFNVPPNTPAYYTRLDVRDSLGVFVDVTAGYDVANNRAFWLFQSVDPITLGPLSDPLKGFLLLQDSANPNYGHGFANFTIVSKEDAQTGDQMNATAKIIFDNNDTIPTNVETNTIDALPPSSKINGLPAASPNSIYLTWSGQDDPGGVGVENYDLYMSTDGGSYTLIRSGMHRTDTTLTVPEIGSYCFFTLARDSVGNTEALRPADVACTFVGSTLPVTWLYFTGVNQGNDNLLRWATGTEINVKDFVLERSADASAFLPVATLKPNGGPARQGQYLYTDMRVDKIRTDALYYRVKQADNDNKFTYSSVVKINLKKDLITKSAVYPNPSKGRLTLAIGTNGLLESNAIIYDNRGRTVQQVRINSTAQNINIEGLAKGIYYIRLSNGETLKILKE